MIWLYVCILIILLAFWIVSIASHLPVPQVDASYSKPFLATAVLIHKLVKKINSKLTDINFVNKLYKNRQLASKLQILYPSETSEMQLYRYYVERTSTILLIIFLGSVVSIIVSFMAVDNRLLVDGEIIYRDAYEGMDQVVDLTAGILGKIENSEVPISVVVPAQVYSYEEAQLLFEQLESNIDSVILAGNESIDHITTALKFPSKIEGYPFSITWECSNYDYLDADGSVHNEMMSDPAIVTAIGDCAYEHNHWYIYRDLLICPQELTEEEILKNEIFTALETQNEKTAANEFLSLPMSIPSGSIAWKEKIKDESPVIILCTFLICIILIPIKEYEINGKINKRAKQLLIEYPAFVSKLTLYLGAGMSVRNCFVKLGHDYEKMNKQSSRVNYLGVELAITAHELETGISELEAYNHLGKRCGSKEYMRFITLLIQNLRKGSTDLISLLNKESVDAFEIRKNEARRLGEEASTKLLLPMVMMLGVVMIIIMVPAYMSFS